MTEQAVIAEFEGALGPKCVAKCSLMRHRMTGKCRGFGFVTLKSGELLRECMTKHKVLKINGRSCPCLPTDRPRPRIYLGNLPYGMDDKELEKELSKMGGPIIDLNVKKGFAFAEFGSPDLADAAVSALDGYKLKGRNIAAERVQEDRSVEDSPMLFVRKLKKETTESTVRDIFEPYGELARVNKSRSNARNAFVEFRNPKDAQRARYCLHRTKCEGVEIAVETARPKVQRDARGVPVRQRGNGPRFSGASDPSDRSMSDYRSPSGYSPDYRAGPPSSGFRNSSPAPGPPLDYPQYPASAAAPSPVQPMIAFDERSGQYVYMTPQQQMMLQQRYVMPMPMGPPASQPMYNVMRADQPPPQAQLARYPDVEQQPYYPQDQQQTQAHQPLPLPQQPSVQQQPMQPLMQQQMPEQLPLPVQQDAPRGRSYGSYDKQDMSQQPARQSRASSYDRSVAPEHAAYESPSSRQGRSSYNRSTESPSSRSRDSRSQRDYDSRPRSEEHRRPLSSERASSRTLEPRGYGRDRRHRPSQRFAPY